MADVRPSPIAGRWYPGNARALEQEIARYLDLADVEPPGGRVMGLVVPHAGLRYSGRTAAYGFRAAQRLEPEIVAVVSPLHSAHPAPLLTTAHDSYATPLGRVEVDRESLELVRDLLDRRTGLELAPVRNDTEHSLEIELPFMQVIWPQFRLLPIMMRDQGIKASEGLAEALAEVLAERRALVVASSDLSHFHRQTQAHVLDAELQRRLERFDPLGIIDGEREGTAYACGRGAIAAALLATRTLGADRVSLLHYETSGDVTGDMSSVVGYGSAVIWRS